MDARSGRCPFCGCLVSPGARFCGGCGRSFGTVASPPDVPRRSGGHGAIVLALVVALAMVAGNIGAGFLLRPKEGGSAAATAVAGTSTGSAPAVTPGSTAGPAASGSTSPTDNANLGMIT